MSPTPSLPWVADRKPARRRLTVDLIVRAGLDILVAEGADAVTMRAVAGRLDTGAASLYAHVRDKSELHQLLLDEIIGEVEIPDPDPERWQEQVKDVTRSFYAALLRHPGIALVNLAHIPVGPNALRTSERMIALLESGGLSPEVVGLAIDLLMLYPTTVAVEDSIWQGRAAAYAEGPQTESDVVAGVEAYYRALPAEHYPRLTAMVPFLVAGDGETRFEFGLNVLVAGLDALKHTRPGAR